MLQLGRHRPTPPPMLLQECLTQIDELARFAGPPETATLKADSILEAITEFKNQIELRALESPQNVDRERERDQTTLLIARLRNAELSARECRREKWLRQRQQFAASKPVDPKTKADLLGDRQQQPATPQGDDDDPDSPAVGVAEQVSSNLRRIHQLAQAEVLRSELNIEELQTSTNSLTSVQNQYSGVDMLLNGSKRLVKLLDQADAKDRRNMQLALSFLGAVLIWIIYRRILKLPVKLLMWSIARFLGILRFISRSSSPSRDDALSPSITDTTKGFIEASVVTDTLIKTIVSSSQAIVTDTQSIVASLVETILDVDAADLSQAEHPDL